MPSTDQSANSAFWELADATAAVELEAPADGQSTARAERVPLGVKINVARLDSQGGLNSAIQQRLAGLQQPSEWKTVVQQKSDAYVASTLHLCRSSTVVLARRPAGMSQLDGEALVRQVLGTLEVDASRVHFTAEDLRTDASKSPSDVVLCFAVGSVTGESLKKMRIEVTDSYAGSTPKATGFCIHARPPSTTEWAAVRNSFRPGRLAALWLSYLPWNSPLREEYDLLVRSGRAGSGITHRQQYLASTTTPAEEGDYNESALLGSNAHTHGQLRVRERSLYGHRLGANAAFAAVGSAIQTRRLEHNRRESAQRFMVDLPKVARSYYDAVLMASVLRWTKPGEAWWGAGPSEESETMRTMLRFGASTDPERAVLFPELLLAAALGKVPLAAIEELRTSFLECRRADPNTDYSLAEEYFELLGWARPETLDAEGVPKAISAKRTLVPRTTSALDDQADRRND